MPVPLFIYVHLPYCRHRCRFCDFTVLTKHSPLAYKNYFKLLITEIDRAGCFLTDVEIQSISFGGGTPSLFPTDLLEKLIDKITSTFPYSQKIEIGLEANPEDINPSRVNNYIQAGITRLSLGVQTFDDNFLKISNRSHGSQESKQALEVLKNSGINFSADIMFGLPRSTVSGFKQDLKLVTQFQPPHLSLYNLTLPQQHPLNKNRPEDSKQEEMILFSENFLKDKGLHKYEISNFAKKGYESQHNLAYWSGKSFLGLGLSAHSYFSNKLAKRFFPEAKYGFRFWQSKSLKIYNEQNLQIGKEFLEFIPPSQIEILKSHENLTDFCHTRLRKRSGFSRKELEAEASSRITKEVLFRIKKLKDRGLILEKNQVYFLSPKGEILSNLVFLELTFTKKELNDL